ncbi:MAG TPA: ribosomal protein S18-alanine N-acetyltransferase [Burkholderiales bacterium]|nr:ribosomal protein S18-alanine N-acetyltransferase [Burkholderiales bacterium]
MSAVLKPQWRFEPLQLDEIDEVVAIEKKIYDFPWTAGNFRDSLRAGYSCWSYRSPDNELVGYGVLMFAVDEAHLLNLSIAEPHQRKGHGSRLLEHFVRVAKQQQAKLLFLEVRPSNPGARALYASFDFQHVGTRRGYYPSFRGREDALVLSLSLANP